MGTHQRVQLHIVSVHSRNLITIIVPRLDTNFGELLTIAKGKEPNKQGRG